MIKRARLNFVGITMVILLFVFWIMGTVSYWILSRNNEHETEDVLKQMITTVKHELDVPVRIRGIIVKETASGQIEMSYDENAFDAEYVENLFNDTKNSGMTKGCNGNVYYKMVNSDTETIFAAIDRSVEAAMLGKTLGTIILVLACAYLLLFCVVWILSYSVIQPVQDAFDKQNRFISDAGHELKTPISVISASADVLAAEGDNEYVENIKEQTKRLGVLINDLLSLAKLEEKTKAENLKDINLSALVMNTVLPFDAVAFEKNKRLETDVAPDIHITADENAVRQVLTILIDNALKYADENTEILCYLGKMNDKLTLGVYNESSTVKAGTEKKIFERFYRDDESRSRETGGSGLGLSIAKKVAENNKWQIHAEIEDKKSIAILIKF